METGAYGRTLGACFGVTEAPSRLTHALGAAPMAVTELRGEAQGGFMTHRIPYEDAFLVGVALDSLANHEYWEGERRVRTACLKPGDALFYDLKRDPRSRIEASFHVLQIYLPRQAMSAIADRAGRARVDGLHYDAGLPVADETLRHLALSMQAALHEPQDLSQAYLDHVVLAAATHVVDTYGGDGRPSPARKGGLAPWQLSRAYAHMSTSPVGACLEQLAQSCGLSRNYFARAFKASAGTSPAAWLLARRVEIVKDCLRRGELRLADIALECGFADQSHMTRVFTRLVGISPGAWRRAQRAPRPDPLRDRQIVQVS